MTVDFRAIEAQKQKAHRFLDGPAEFAAQQNSRLNILAQGEPSL